MNKGITPEYDSSDTNFLYRREYQTFQKNELIRDMPGLHIAPSTGQGGPP
jgi:hypothetical protein